MGLSNLMNVLAMIIKTKVLALLLGPLGVGIFSLIQNTSNLLLSILPIGSVGFTKYVSEYYSDNKIEKINFLFRRLLSQNILFIAFVSVIIVLSPGSLSRLFYSNEEYWKYIIILSVLLPLGMLSNFLESYMKAIRLIGRFVKMSILNSIVSILIFIPMVYSYQLYGALAASAFSFATNILLCIYFLKKSNVLPNFRKIENVKKEVFKNIYSMGLAMLIMVFIQQVTVLFIRTLIISKFGIDSLGVYQSIYSVSTNYFGLFFVTVISYAIPKLSSYKNTAFVIDEINRILKFFILLYTPLLVVCFVFRKNILLLLFSSSFLPAADLLIFQLLGELFKAITWVIGLWFVPLAMKIRQWFLFEILFNITYFLIAYILVSYYEFGMISVTFSYFLSYLIFALLNIWYIKHILNFTFKFKSLKILLVSILSILLVFLISQYDLFLGYYSFIPVLLIWTYVLINKNEVLQTKYLLLEVLKIKR